MKKKPNARVACVQAAPVYFDLDKTVGKGIRLIEEAAKNGAKYVSFPEVWIPGYPLFAWLNAPIHAAGWPCLALDKEQSYALGKEATWAVSQTYALEGQCYVLASTMNATPEVVAMLCDTSEKKAYLTAGGGASMIFGPDGAPLCDPIPHDQEGILYAEVTFDAIGIAKTTADPAGHYARPYVARLLLNTAPARRVVPMDEFMQVRACTCPGCDGNECSCADPVCA